MTKRAYLEDVLEDAMEGKIGARLFLTAVLAVLEKLDESEAAIVAKLEEVRLEIGKGTKPPK